MSGQLLLPGNWELEIGNRQTLAGLRKPAGLALFLFPIPDSLFPAQRP
ncbi:hypothetical protein SAMN04487785_10654 [Dyella jiangningensis]|nr:hypothetical protein BDW41_104179 [Dyella sp. AtDHG13]SDK23392.1 hypothetical protein SAMN04487785_10654 [Dyella jiangningensis]